MDDDSRVVIEVALNGGRDRREQPAVPYAPAEVVAEGRRAAEAGAAILHLHARRPDGGWSADPAWYAETLRGLREAVPGPMLGITSLRPAGVAVGAVLDLLSELARDPATKPDLISINLGHVVSWEPVEAETVPSRRTRHFPNDYEDVVAILDACRRLGVIPELGVMDLGFVSNAVALRQDGRFPDAGWFLLELDSEAYGAGPQVAPSTVANYERLVAELRQHFPGVARVVHGQGIAGYAVLCRALEDGEHVRVGFEDCVCLPDGALARSNAELVAWAIEAARAAGREPVPAVQAQLTLARRQRQPLTTRDE